MEYQNESQQNHVRKKPGKMICNVRCRVLEEDWDTAARYRITMGKDFRITEKGKTDTNHNAGRYSIHSPLYGTDYNDDNAYEDRYSCTCGNLIGANFEGVVCPQCKTAVEFIDIDMTITGWIILDRDKIIHPHLYKKIQAFIGPKRILENILTYKDESKRDTASNKYDGIGMIEFRQRFSEIMDYYLKKNGRKKLDSYNYIMDRVSMVFASAIPVYSSHLRPFIIRYEEIRYTRDDELFRHIFSNSVLLNNGYELEYKIAKMAKRKDTKDVNYLRRENILHNIQKDLNDIWDLDFNNIKKKTGIIRNNVLGGRLNFTARNVIVPSKDLRPDEIEVGYTTFLELYKLEIVSLLIRTHNIPPSEAWRMWSNATVVFDQLIYNIMNYLVKKRNVIVEINRNPTRFMVGSMVTLRNNPSLTAGTSLLM